MNLSIFVIVPLLMLLGLWLARNDKQVRGVMVAGASVLLALSIYLVFAFLEARETMPADQVPMLFTYCVPWFEPLHINYSLGVDGISVVMILLTSIIVVAVLIFCASGVAFDEAIGTAVSAIGNVGVTIGQFGPSSGTYADYPTVAKWTATFVMLIGRLEIFTVLLLFSRALWKK